MGRARDEAGDANRELSLLMIGYWVRFAATGDPNGDNAPAWPRYRPSADQALELGDQVEPRAGVYKELSDFFNRVAAERPTPGSSGKPTR